MAITWYGRTAKGPDRAANGDFAYALKDMMILGDTFGSGGPELIDSIMAPTADALLRSNGSPLSRTFVDQVLRPLSNDIHARKSGEAGCALTVMKGTGCICIGTNDVGLINRSDAECLTRDKRDMVDAHDPDNIQSFLGLPPDREMRALCRDLTTPLQAFLGRGASGGPVYLVCSTDFLPGMPWLKDLQHLLFVEGLAPADAAQAIIDRARDGGCRDDATVVIGELSILSCDEAAACERPPLLLIESPRTAGEKEAAPGADALDDIVAAVKVRPLKPAKPQKEAPRAAPRSEGFSLLSLFAVALVSFVLLAGIVIMGKGKAPGSLIVRDAQALPLAVDKVVLMPVYMKTTVKGELVARMGAGRYALAMGSCYLLEGEKVSKYHAPSGKHVSTLALEGVRCLAGNGAVAVLLRVDGEAGRGSLLLLDPATDVCREIGKIRPLPGGEPVLTVSPQGDVHLEWGGRTVEVSYLQS